jgi:hypothetical protein
MSYRIIPNDPRPTLEGSTKGEHEMATMERTKRLIVALSPDEYRRLSDAAERSVREPEQQLHYYVRRALSRVSATPKNTEVSMP